MDFLNELQQIKRNFFKKAYNNAQRVYEETFQVDIRNGFLVMRINGMDRFGDRMEFRQTVEQRRSTGSLQELPMNILKNGIEI